MKSRGFYVISVSCLLCLCARLFVCALWSPAGKGLTSLLSFVVSNCEFVIFPLVSWVRCGTRLYRFLIFASLLTFLASGLSTYDFSSLYTTLPHNLIKENLIELIEQTFNREGSLYLACNDKNAFITSEQPKRYKLCSCQKMCDALHYLLDNIFIRFGSKLY